jgi:large subunit ribosomal protein L9
MLEKAQEDETLYGSVTGPMIAHRLKALLDLDIDPKAVKLPEPFKRLGVYSVEIKLHPEVTAKIKVYVNRQPD